MGGGGGKEGRGRSGRLTSVCTLMCICTQYEEESINPLGACLHLHSSSHDAVLSVPPFAPCTAHAQRSRGETSRRTAPQSEAVRGGVINTNPPKMHGASVRGERVPKTTYALILASAVAQQGSPKQGKEIAKQLHFVFERQKKQYYSYHYYFY